MNTRIAGNAEQLPDAGLLETAKQEVANLHSSAGAPGHRVCLLRSFGNLQDQWRDRKSSPRPSRIISALWQAVSHLFVLTILRKVRMLNPWLTLSFKAFQLGMKRKVSLHSG